MSDLTPSLQATVNAETGAAHEMLPLVYEELRRLAVQRLRAEAPGQTLQATALVHEAYLRLASANDAPQWESRGHFFAAAAEAMRRILVENVRRKRSLKRGGNLTREGMEEIGLVAAGEPMEDLIALDEALEKLAIQDPEKAKLVKLRYFAGMTIAESAELLGISDATAKRWWTYARTWLSEEMAG